MKKVKFLYVFMFLFTAALANPCMAGFIACENDAWEQTFDDATGEFDTHAYSIALGACTAGLIACADALNPE